MSAEYAGYRLLDVTPEEMAIFPNQTKTDFLLNEYAVLTQEGTDYSELYRWCGTEFRFVQFRQINNRFFGKVKPRNIQQKLAIDLLYNHDVKVKLLKGNYGSGKTFLMCAAALDMVEHGVFDKIVYVRNNIEVRNSRPIGHLPGDNNEKLLPFAMPFADFLGGRDMLERMIDGGTIEITHLGFIRGRDFRNSIVMCSEAENMTRDHMQLLISRIGEGSELWIDGDNRQIDAEVFRQDNGIDVLTDRLKGHPLFGCVKLLKTERSETAALADLLD